MDVQSIAEKCAESELASYKRRLSLHFNENMLVNHVHKHPCMPSGGRINLHVIDYEQILCSLNHSGNAERGNKVATTCGAQLVLKLTDLDLRSSFEMSILPMSAASAAAMSSF
jgi:hypothetical protein